MYIASLFIFLGQISVETINFIKKIRKRQYIYTVKPLNIKTVHQGKRVHDCKICDKILNRSLSYFWIKSVVFYTNLSEKYENQQYFYTLKI